MAKKPKRSLWIIPGLIVLAGIFLALPPVWSRVSYHAQELYTSLKY